MKILIVDDDPIVVQSCLRILEAEGMEIHAANSVEEGMEMLKAASPAPFDMLLTDIKMPGQDGFEMIRMAYDIQPDVAILMMTGYLTARTMEKGRSLGAHNYIAKPFTPEELVDAVWQTIKQNQGDVKK